jgi:2-polyprenyl-3-methyl-5-hydroxy-6-metoxy-1,4-benzoquinol methylase
VTGVDSVEIHAIRDRVDDFVLADLENGVPRAVGDNFDVVIAADVIEHVRHPQRLLRQMSDVLSPTGQIVICTPNFGHWYARGRVVTGTFDYDRRGILDQTHLRFFSRKSLRRTIASSGLDLLELRYCGLPFDVLTRDDSWKARSAGPSTDAWSGCAPPCSHISSSLACAHTTPGRSPITDSMGLESYARRG